jgi:(2Fe-2S) ferredoxin
MHPAPFAPKLHLFVCANRRPDASPLGPGCGEAGSQVYAALKREVARRGAYTSIWITETRCLGVCPKHGATVAVYPKQAIWADVVEGDARSLLDGAIAAASGAAPQGGTP